jgi:hypothetical protein
MPQCRLKRKLFLYYLQFYKRIGNKLKNSHLPAQVTGQFTAHVNLVCNLTHMYFRHLKLLLLLLLLLYRERN